MKFFIKTIYLILLFGLFLLNSTKGFSKSDIKKYTKGRRRQAFQIPMHVHDESLHRLSLVRTG